MTVPKWVHHRPVHSRTVHAGVTSKSRFLAAFTGTTSQVRSMQEVLRALYCSNESQTGEGARTAA